MDCTHILIVGKAYSGKTLDVIVYNDEGQQVYKASMDCKASPEIKSTGGVDNATREDVVRFITRNCLDFDVAMSTPMFGMRK